MTIPLIPIYQGDIPDRNAQEAPVFTENSIKWLDYQVIQIPATNNTLNGINAAVVSVNDDAASASASAAVSAANANYKGEWSTLTGALAIPASVLNGANVFWQLVADLPDVTSSEPGVTSDWVAIVNAGAVDWLALSNPLPFIIDNTGIGRSVTPVRDGGTTHINEFGVLTYDASPDATNILPLAWVLVATATEDTNAAIAHDKTLTASKLNFPAVNDAVEQDSGDSAINESASGAVYLSGETGTTISIELTNKVDFTEAKQITLTNDPVRYDMATLFNSTVGNVWFRIKRNSGDTAVFCYADSEQAEFSNISNGSVGAGSGTSLDGINQNLRTANGIETTITPENLIIESQNLSAWTALGDVSLALGTVVAPDSLNSPADVLTISTSGTGNRLAISAAFTDTSQELMSYVIMRDAGVGRVNVRCVPMGGTSNTFSADFIFATRAFANMSNVNKTEIIELEDNWLVVGISTTMNGTNSSLQIRLSGAVGSSDTGDVDLFAFQINNGDFIKNYLETKLSPVTGFNTKYLFDYKTHHPDSVSDYAFVCRGRVLGDEGGAALIDACDMTGDNSGGLGIQPRRTIDGKMRVYDGRGVIKSIDPSPISDNLVHTIGLDFIGLTAFLYIDGKLEVTFTRGTVTPSQPPTLTPTLGRMANDSVQSSLYAQYELAQFYNKPLGAAGHLAVGGLQNV